MTNLNCGVANCSYNKNELCSLNSIDVGGNKATECEETCCKSFIEKSEGSFSNDASEASLQTEIGCKAENCEYNSNCKCHAEAINVAGDFASSEGETCCETFRCS